MLLLVFLFLTLFTAVSADGYKCAGNWTVDPPNDLTTPYYYPEKWNDTIPPVQFNSSQICLWKINVPYGMYATVVFHKYSDSLDSGINYIYPNGNIDWIQDNDTSPFIFTSPQFYVKLNVSDNQGLFSFKVVWSYYPSNLCHSNTALDAADILPSKSTNCIVTYFTPSQVRLSSFFNLPGQLNVVMRLSAVFDGDSTNGTFLGTINDATQGGVVSTGRELTIYTFGSKTDYTLFLVMDIYAASDVMYFNTPNCYPSGLCNIDLFAAGADNYATVTTSRNVDYVGMSSFFPYNSSISIYEGTITSDGLLATLNQSDYYNKLPMAVKSSLKIYKIDSGRYTLRLYNTSEKASYGTLEVGRIVNIHSFDYQMRSTAQYTKENFKTGSNGGLMNFNFNVTYFDAVAKTKLEITVFQNGSVVDMFRFSKENPPTPTAFPSLGDSVTVEYQPYEYFTKGFEVVMVCGANDKTTTRVPTSVKTTSKSTDTTSSNPTTTPSKAPSSTSTVTSTASITSPATTPITTTPSTTLSTTPITTKRSKTTKHSKITKHTTTTKHSMTTTTPVETTTNGVDSFLNTSFFTFGVFILFM